MRTLSHDSCIGFQPNGLAAAKIDGKWGFIDKDGNETVPLIYDSVTSFYNGMGVRQTNGDFNNT